MKAILIDDEEHGRENLTALLSIHYGDDIEILDKCKSLDEGLKSIKKHLPEIVFLDIDMPNKSGMEIFDFIPNIDFHLIFVTAYSDHAPKACSRGASGYLTKPIDEDELKALIERIKSEEQEFNSDFAADRLYVSTKNGFTLIPYNEICVIKADGNYSIVKCMDQEHTVSKNIGLLKKHLKSPPFFEVSRSAIVNLNFLVGVNTKESSINLKNGIQEPISGTKLNELKKRFRNL
ncbi:MAG: LytTR family DNA-binding domain-containing protein [Cyclobacteriaceae bacterium]|nr:response regulator transcription factor [Cyclobacteriaceae bacterium]MCH8515445.1 LytTR family DNA-binding domain-containing protein [Cyclobacteriaceae bacterium]